jgi:hypothetical protein
LQLADKHEHAARYPWLPISPDSPEPERRGARPYGITDAMLPHIAFPSGSGWIVAVTV